MNRRDCCGGRLAATKVFIGTELCGSVQGGTQNGKWYEVKCSKPVRGNKVRLVTVQNTYLSISGIEVWTGAAQMTRTTTSTSSTRRMMPGMMKMGGFGGMMRGRSMTKTRQPPTFRMTGSKAKLVNPE